MLMRVLSLFILASLSWVYSARAVVPEMVFASKEYPLRVYAYKENGIPKLRLESEKPGMNVAVRRGDFVRVPKDRCILQKDGQTWGIFSFWWNDSADRAPSYGVFNLDILVEKLKKLDQKIVKIINPSEIVKGTVEKIDHWIFIFQSIGPLNQDPNLEKIHVDIESLTDKAQLIYDSNERLSITKADSEHHVEDTQNGTEEPSMRAKL